MDPITGVRDGKVLDGIGLIVSYMKESMEFREKSDFLMQGIRSAHIGWSLGRVCGRYAAGTFHVIC